MSDTVGIDLLAASQMVQEIDKLRKTIELLTPSDDNGEGIRVLDNCVNEIENASNRVAPEALLVTSTTAAFKQGLFAARDSAKSSINEQAIPSVSTRSKL